jgi:phosphate-selective porin OprO/OprP
MSPTTWRKFAGAIALGTVAVLMLAGAAAADDQQLLLELKARLDRLERDNAELRNKLDAKPAPKAEAPPKDVQKEVIDKRVDAYLKEKEEKKMRAEKLKADMQEAEGFTVGSDLGLKARWRNDYGLWFETPNKDFQSHVGFFTQWDTVAFSQSPISKRPTELGDLQDGTFFRRIRPIWDGTAWGFVEWNCILALEQIGAIGTAVTNANGAITNQPNGQGLINVDELWGGAYGIPIIGRIRFGHLKVPQGLEGNQMTSSRAQTFNENAAYTDAFYNVFGTGVQIANTAFDRRVFWQGMLYRNDFRGGGSVGGSRANTGADFGDGDYCVTGRLGGLLIDACEDRHLLHLAVSGTYRVAERADATTAGNFPGTAGDRMIRYRARPELRDGIGGFGDGGSLPGDTTRMVDTGNVIAKSDSVVGTEAAWILGPLSIVGEWAFAFLNDATTGSGRTLQKGTRSFNGGYVTVSYFITGETRNYDKDFGIFSRNYVTPFSNFWAHNGADGWTLGRGAWEVAVRYSYLNLNDGPIQGGVMDGTTIGLNWYWNTNMKLQFEYLRDNRWDKNTAQGGRVGAGVDGFGTRMQISF